MLLHAACASSLHVPPRWSDAHCADGSRRWIEMIRLKTICPLAKPDDTKVHISRRRASPQRHGASTAQHLNASAPLAGGRLHLRSAELRGPAELRRRRRRQRGACTTATSAGLRDGRRAAFEAGGRAAALGGPRQPVLLHCRPQEEAHPSSLPARMLGGLLNQCRQTGCF